MNSPYRSAMCAGCHGVGVPRSATYGTASSATTSSANPIPLRPAGASSSAIQPSWHTVTPSRHRAVGLPPCLVVAGGAQPQQHQSGMRRTTYPSVTTPKSVLEERPRDAGGEHEGTGDHRQHGDPVADVVGVVRRREPRDVHPRPPDGEEHHEVARQARGQVRLALRVVQLVGRRGDGDDEAEVEEQLERGGGAVRLGGVARHHGPAPDQGRAHAAAPRLSCHHRSTARAATS